MTGAGIVRRRGFVIARRCRLCGGSWGGAMVVLLALLAALLFALAAAAEQRAASQQRQWRGWRQGLRFAARLASSPLWIAGWLADVLGFGAQAGALHVGSLSVVQPLLVTTLLFSLALAAWGSGRRLRPADW